MVRIIIELILVIMCCILMTASIFMLRNSEDIKYKVVWGIGAALWLLDGIGNMALLVDNIVERF